MNLFEGLRVPVADAMERAMSRLAGEGVRFIDIDLPEAVEVGSVFGRILAGELVHFLGRERLFTQRGRIDPVTWARIERELDIDARDAYVCDADSANSSHYSAKNLRPRRHRLSDDSIVSGIRLATSGNPLELLRGIWNPGEIRDLGTCLACAAFRCRCTLPANFRSGFSC